MGISVQDCPKEIGKQILLRHQREKCRIESAFPDHYTKDGSFVIIDG